MAIERIVKRTVSRHALTDLENELRRLRFMAPLTEQSEITGWREVHNEQRTVLIEELIDYLRDREAL